MRSSLGYSACARWAGVLAAWVCGCASGAEPNVTPPPPNTSRADSGTAWHGRPANHGPAADLATEADYCAARAQAECSPAVVMACGLTSTHACETVRAGACKATLPQGTTYQPRKAKACIDAVLKAYATATMTANALAAIGEACGSVLFAGPGTARASCATDYDCNSASGLRCIVPTPELVAGMGNCFAPVAVTTGGDCSPQGSVCATGEHCDPQGLVCTLDFQVNQQCNPPGWPCAAGLKCSAPGLPFATCETGGGADGDPCMAGTDCVYGLCDKATGQASGTCASSVTLSALDALCGVFE